MVENIRFKDNSKILEFTRKYAILIVAGFLSALGINGFIVPNQLLGGGLGGIAIMLNYLFDLNIGVMIFVLNLPLFFMAYKKLDREFAVSTFINMFIFSFIMTATTGINVHIGINDPVLVAIFGGILTGVGMGITFRNKSSQGGLDIVAAYCKRKYGINVGSALMATNLVIVGIGGMLFGLDKAMYTLISMYVAYGVVDKVQQYREIKKSIMIISNSPNEIGHEIMAKMNRGVTFLDGKGAYTKDSKQVIYTIVNSNEIKAIKEIVESYDKEAFLSINEVDEVKGNGFKERFL